MSTKFPHLRAAVVSQPWAILPTRLEAIAEVIERRINSDVRLSREEIDAIKGERMPNGVSVLYAMDAHNPHVFAGPADPMAPTANVIAVINIFGIIAQHANEVDDISGPGGTSTERVTTNFRAAMNDPSVKAVVLHENSPGGNVYGVQALGDEIFKARGQKPIVAQVNSLAASAAYWIASQADEIVITPGGEVGSIGVYALHEDVSKAAENAGVKFTFISAGKYKVEGNQFTPLDEEASSAIQRSVDSYYKDFVSAVARGRGVSTADVLNGFGQGRVEKDKDAVKAGMADRVGTLDDTLRRLSSKKTKATANAALISAPSNAATIEIQRKQASASAEPTFHLIGEWPECLRMSGDLLDQMTSCLAVAEDGMQIILAFENGGAHYECIGMTANDEWIGKRTIVTESPKAATSKPDADAFRRRRHAARSRSV